MAWLRPIKISRRVLKTLVILGDRTTINWVVAIPGLFQNWVRNRRKNEKESDLHSIFLSIFGPFVPCPGKPWNHRNFDSSPYSKMPSSNPQEKSSFLPPWNDQVFGSRFRVHWVRNRKTKVFEVGSKYFTSIFCTLDAGLRWNENPAYPWILHRFIKLLNALPWLFLSSIN